MVKIFILEATFLLVFSIDATARSVHPINSQGIENFNNLVRDFVDCIAIEKNIGVKWWDFDASNIYFDENPTHKRYTTNIKHENDEYTNTKPYQTLLDTKTESIVNSMPTPLKTKIHYKNIVQTKESVGFKKGSEYGIKGEVKAGYPIFNFVLKISPSVKKTRQFTKENNNKTTFVAEKEFDIEVFPNSKATCVFETVETWEESDWTADLRISGYIAIRLEGSFNYKAVWRLCYPKCTKKVAKKNRKCHKNYIKGKKNVYFYPITSIVQNNTNFKIDRDAITFKGIGKYKGPVDISTTSNCKQEKLKGK